MESKTIVWDHMEMWAGSFFTLFNSVQYKNV